jgi:ferrochelatase
MALCARGAGLRAALRRSPSLACRSSVPSTAPATAHRVQFATSALSEAEAQNKQGGPTAVLMMNLGGPGSQDEVYPFLRRLFADREIIELPVPAKWQLDYFGPWVAKRRTPSIQEQYNEMPFGGGSPIKYYTEEQGKAMVKHLDRISPATAPHKFYIGFRYASPMTEDSLAEMKKDGVTRAIAFTQYPQFSCATTGSSLNELWRQLVKGGYEDSFEWSVIDRWPTHPGLIRSFADCIEEGLQGFEPEERDDVVILFSAHSLPMKFIDRGDPYPQEVGATVGRVMEELGLCNSYRLVWQSKVGPSQWLGMQTDDALKGLARIQRKNVLVVPIAFTSDHVETLFEIDIEYKEEAEELGLNMQRAPSLNLKPEFTETMAEIVASHLRSEAPYHLPTTKQYPLRCPGCTNQACADSKEFFVTQTPLPNPPLLRAQVAAAEVEASPEVAATS